MSHDDAGRGPTAEPWAVAVIHARGGSRRVPGKNLRLLGGMPLIAYAVRAAKKARRLRDVIVSTDDDAIAREAESRGARVPFRRPSSLAEDVASELVTRHALEFLEREAGRCIEICVTIQPTTPFLSGEDIDACITQVASGVSRSCLTVRKTHDRPEWMLRPEGATARLFLEGTLKGERGISQSLESLFVPNGGAYASRRDLVLKDGRLVDEPTAFHLMPLERSIDIDEEPDFLVAEALGKHFGFLA